MAKKITFHFSESDQANLKEMVNLIGQTDTYGADAKVIKLGITYYLERLKYWAEVLPDLNTSEGSFFVTSIKKLQKRKQAQIKIDKLAKEGN